MSKIHEGTSAGTGKIRIQKNVGDILIETEYIPNFDNIRLTAYIERPNDNNHEICQDALLLEYAVLSKLEQIVRPLLPTLNDNEIHFIKLELGSNAGLLLQNGDTLVLEIYGLSNGKVTRIYNLDDVDYSTHYRKLETKNILAGEMDKVLQPNGCEFVSVGSENNIRLVVLKVQKGNAVHRLEYTPTELRQLMYDLYPYIGEITQPALTNSQFPERYNRLLIPVFDAIEFQIFKINDGVIPVTFMYDRKFEPSMSKGQPMEQMYIKTRR